MNLQSPEINEIAAALLEVQKAIKPAYKGSDNPYHESRYSNLESIWKTSKDILHKNKILISHQALPIEGIPHLACTLYHVPSSQWLRGYFQITPAKPGPQPYAACLTYMRRYSTACMIFIVLSDDDDGETASGRGNYTEPPAKEFIPFTRASLVMTGPNKGEKFEDLPDSVCEGMSNEELVGPPERDRDIEYANEEWSIRVEENTSSNE